jgi:hypothetical protein
LLATVSVKFNHSTCATERNSTDDEPHFSTVTLPTRLSGLRRPGRSACWKQM